MVRLIDIALRFWAEQVRGENSEIQLTQTLIPALSKIARVFVFVMALLLILQNAGYSVSSLLAGLGIGGLAVALAAQETLANLFGSIALFIDKPFIAGDRIQVEKYDGTVEKIGLRSTRIRQLDGTVVSIPNRTMGQASINNVTRRPTIRATSTISLVYDTPSAKMREALQLLQTIYREHPLTADYLINWTKFGPSSLDIDIIYWCRSTDWRQYCQAQEEIHFVIKEKFEAAGLTFAYPTQTIHMHQPSSAAARVKDPHEAS
jgi:MscS family membrane protein